MYESGGRAFLLDHQVIEFACSLPPQWRMMSEESIPEGDRPPSYSMELVKRPTYRRRSAPVFWGTPGDYGHASFAEDIGKKYLIPEGRKAA
jgi:hypothetical protein